MCMARSASERLDALETILVPALQELQDGLQELQELRAQLRPEPAADFVVVGAPEERAPPAAGAPAASAASGSDSAWPSPAPAAAGARAPLRAFPAVSAPASAGASPAVFPAASPAPGAVSAEPPLAPPLATACAGTESRRSRYWLVVTSERPPLPQEGLYKTERAAEQAAARAGLVPRSSTYPVPDLTEAAVRWAQLGRSLPLPRFW